MKSLIAPLMTLGTFAAITSAGTISGRVTRDFFGTPITGVSVTAWDFDSGRWVANTHTDAGGHYVIADLDAGTYRVEAQHTTYVAEYYDDVYGWYEATPVAVSASEETSGIDFSLTSGGTITGRVTRDSDGAPVEGARVNAYDNRSDVQVAEVYTDAAGNYVVTVPYAGTYRIAVCHELYLVEYYRDVHGWCEATAITITKGQEISGIDFSLDLPGTLTGRVTRQSDGAPIKGIRVTATDLSGCDWIREAYTDETGHYAIGDLRTGNYHIGAHDPNGLCLTEYYDNSPPWGEITHVSVATGQEVAGIDFILTRGGTVTGRVTRDPDGAPLAGITVGAFCLDGGNSTETCHTDDDGCYTIAGLYAGSYRIGTMDTIYLDEYYDNVQLRSEATPVTIIAEEEISGIDFGLARGGSIVGRVMRESDGEPLKGVLVDAYNISTHSGESARTDLAGNYVISGLSAGVYYVCARDTTYTYLTEYYNNVYALHSFDEVTPVGVELGKETSGIDFYLSMPGRITGRVTLDSGDTPIEWPEVIAYDFYNGEFVDSAWPDNDGYFALGGLYPGMYRVQADTAWTPYAAEWFDDAHTWKDAAAVSVREGQQTGGIDFGLEEGYTISGMVTDKHTGQPLPFVYVGCWHEDMQWWQYWWTGSSGKYQLTGLPPGEVNIILHPDDLYSSSPYARVGRTIHLVADTSGVNFALPQGATLSGRVVDAETAQPVSGVQIDYSSEWHRVWQNAYPDADGYFTLTNLPPGMGELEAHSWAYGPYISLSWPANLIYLEEGQHVSGRVIALRQGVRVQGHVKDVGAQPVPWVEVNFDSPTYKGDVDTDSEGRYELYLPVGSYAASVDFDADYLPDGQWASRRIGALVPDSAEVEMPDILAYSYMDGDRISGTVVHSGGWGTRSPFVLAFEAGTIITSETYAALREICGTFPADTGEFVIPILPPGDYDLYLTAEYYDADDVGSVVVCDRVLNVAAGTSGLVLNAVLGQGTLQGAVRNVAGQPILGATIFIADAAGEFAGAAESGPGGLYDVPNLAAGTYNLTAMHPKYRDVQTTVEVVDGTTTQVDTFVMPFTGGKEASDLNGDGLTDAADLAALGEQWLAEGDLDANLDQSGLVDLADLARMADLWRSEAMWTLTGSVP